MNLFFNEFVYKHHKRNTLFKEQIQINTKNYNLFKTLLTNKLTNAINTRANNGYPRYILPATVKIRKDL